MAAMKDKEDRKADKKVKVSLKKADFEKFQKFVWNGAAGEFLGRNGENWLKITIFYIAFYAALGGFWMFSYFIFDAVTITQDQPRWTLDSGLIGIHPGVSIRPRENSETSLISYDPEIDVYYWTNKLKSYIQEVEEAQNISSNMAICSHDSPASKTQSCKIEMKEFGTECTADNGFGYPSKTPCFLIKLNRIYGWKPEPFGINSNGVYEEELLDKDISEHTSLPQDLRNIFEQGKNDANPTSFFNTVWFSCQGKSGDDVKYLGESPQFEFYPKQGIPSYYFPYYKQPGYQSPFIFVKLTNPKTDVRIHIECRPWWRDIVYDKLERVGFVRFEFYISSNSSHTQAE